MFGRRGFVALIVLLLGGCATMAVDSGESNAALHDRLLALETGSWHYVRDRDLAAMRGFLAEEVLLVFSDGSRFDRDRYVASLADQTLSGLKIENSRAIRISPDVGTLTYKVTYTSATPATKPATVIAEVTSTYVRRNGKWLSIVYQETPLR